MKNLSIQWCVDQQWFLPRKSKLCPLNLSGESCRNPLKIKGKKVFLMKNHLTLVYTLHLLKINVCYLF